MKERIKEIRKALGLTLEQFGEPVGVSKSAMSRLESGTNNLTEQMIKSICREFNVSEEWLQSRQEHEITNAFARSEFIRVSKLF